jgi:hypothetical protein
MRIGISIDVPTIDAVLAKCQEAGSASEAEGMADSAAAS